MPRNTMMRIERRDFLKIGSLAIVSIAIAAQKSVRAAGPHVDKKDPQRRALATNTMGPR